MKNILYFISISEKCNFGRYKNKLNNIQVYIETMTTFKKIPNRKFLLFYLKDFIFDKYIFTMYKL